MLGVMRYLMLYSLLVTATVYGAEYHVAPNGRDQASGSAEDPFATIQRAAEQLKPGDTCIIRSGTYREMIRPAQSGDKDKPILFRPAEGATVVITGTDLVTGWVRHADHIYRAQVNGNPDQVFVNGQRMIPARYPNAGPNPFKPSFIEVDLNQLACQSDAIALSNIDWSGGAMWGTSQRLGWVFGSAPIVSATTNSLTLAHGMAYWRNGAGRVVLSGVLAALDSEREWHFQDNQLWLWAPGGNDPSARLVEVTRRRWGFDLSNRQYIEVKGVHLFAASVNLDQAEHCVLDGLRVRYASFQRNMKGGFNRNSGSNIDAEGLGIAMGGSNNILRNSVISENTGDGVSVWGNSNTVENCVVHDCNLEGSDCAPVTCTGTGHIIRDNTLFNAARSILVHRHLVGGKILRNHLYNAGLLCRDLGMTYTYQTDGQGTEIAYNHIHHNFAEPPGCVGIYLDDQSQGHIVHHNLIHDIGEAFAMNPPDSMRNLLFHNTSAKSSRAGIGMGSHRKQDLTGTRIFNNIFMGHLSANIMTNTQVEVTNNVLKGTDPRFVDVDKDDYTLQPDSPAIDLGREFPPYTDGFQGKAPDAGAFELGVKPWTCGSSIPGSEWNEPVEW